MDWKPLEGQSYCDDHRDKIAALALSPRPCGASGGCWDASFLRSNRPLHSAHMGCENMGPMLYSLVRFIKPRKVLEVGAGYTSIWILQAATFSPQDPLHPTPLHLHSHP